MCCILIDYYTIVSIPVLSFICGKFKEFWRVEDVWSEEWGCKEIPGPVARRLLLAFLFTPPLPVLSSHSMDNAFSKLVKYSSNPAQQFFSITPIHV